MNSLQDFPEIQEQSPTVEHADIKRQFQQWSKRWIYCWKLAKVQRSVTKVSLYFFTDSVLEALDTPSYLSALNRRPEMYCKAHEIHLVPLLSRNVRRMFYRSRASSVLIYPHYFKLSDHNHASRSTCPTSYHILNKRCQNANINFALSVSPLVTTTK